MGKDLEKTITGIIYPAKKDSKGNIISVLIDSMDDDQDGYMVSPGKKSDELLKALNKKIEAFGKISEDDAGNLLINVKTYKLFDDV